MLLLPAAGILNGGPMSDSLCEKNQNKAGVDGGSAATRADPDWKSIKSGEFSFQLNPTHDIIIAENTTTHALQSTKSFNVYDTINATARKAVDRIPAWLNESVCWKFTEMTDGQQVAFANLILNTSMNASYIDELAYMISYLPLQILTYPSADIRLFVENIDSMYKISHNLKYAKIVDTNRSDGLHTTIVYAVPGGNLTLPEEIYYEYIATPRASREQPLYINTTTLNVGDHNTGVFWRTYLYNQTTDLGYPVLADYLKNETLLWKGKRDDVSDNGAIGAVSRWEREVVPTFGIGSGTRSSQSVIIYKHHWGMCGENSDILGAAGKIALIPTVSTLNLEAWHGWNEFYERGWHQWEAYSNNVDNPMSQGGYGSTSVFTSLNTDSDQLSATQHYTATTNFTVNVRDANGWPVGGAVVEITTAPTYNAYNGIGLIGNATDASGKVRFLIGINFDYYVHVYSSCGSYPSSASSLVLAVTNAQAGVNYTYNMTVSGKIMAQPPTLLYNDTEIFLDRYNVSVKSMKQSLRNYMDPWYSHTIWNAYTDRYDLWVLFLDDSNLSKYQSSQPYVAARLMWLDQPWNTTTLPGDRHWNLVVSGRYQTSAHTTGAINVTLERFTGKPKAVILQPFPGTYFINQMLNFLGTVEPFIQQLGPYSYSWVDNVTGQISNMQSFSTIIGLGYHNITFVVSNGSGEVDRSWVHLFVKYPNRAPVAAISEPSEWQVYEYLELCHFSANGSYDPDFDVMTYDWAVPDIGYWMSSLPYFSILLPPGNYTVVLTAMDPAGLNSTASVNVSCLPQDLPPEPMIKYPGNHQTYYNDTLVPLSAKGSYDPEGKVLTYTWISSIDGVISTAYEDEVYLSGGNHTITLRVEDSKHNASDSVEITVLNRTYLIEHPPVAAIRSPYDGNTYYINDVIFFSSQGSFDPDGLPLTYTWTLNGLMISEMANFTDKLEEGQYHLELEVFDGVLNANASIDFKVVDRPPVISIAFNGTELNGSSTLSFKENEDVTLDASASYDPDGGSVTFMWYVNASQVSPFPTWQPDLGSGHYLVRLEVKDDSGKVSIKELDLTVIEVIMPDDDDILPNQTTNQTDEPDDEKGNLVLYVLLAVLILIAVAAIVVFLVIRNRNKDAEEPAQTEADLAGVTPGPTETAPPKKATGKRTKTKKAKKAKAAGPAKVPRSAKVDKSAKVQKGDSPEIKTPKAGSVFELDEMPEDDVHPVADGPSGEIAAPTQDAEEAEGAQPEDNNIGEVAPEEDLEPADNEDALGDEAIEDEFGEPDDEAPKKAARRTTK